MWRRNLLYKYYLDRLSITVGAWSKARTVFARSNAGIVDSNPTRGVDVCIVCIYSVFVLFCVQVEDLRRADSPSKQSHRLCIVSYNWKCGQWPTNGCIAIIINLDLIYRGVKIDVCEAKIFRTSKENMDWSMVISTGDFFFNLWVRTEKRIGDFEDIA
jgi:hypothetical protein